MKYLISSNGHKSRVKVSQRTDSRPLMSDYLCFTILSLLFVTYLDPCSVDPRVSDPRGTRQGSRHRGARKRISIML